MIKYFITMNYLIKKDIIKKVEFFKILIKIMLAYFIVLTKLLYK